MKKSTKKIVSALAGSSMLASGAVAQAAAQPSVTVAEAQASELSKVANVEGEFIFNQDQLTPADEVFNLFGTALTGACAAPSFMTETAIETHYINVGGKMRKDYTVNLASMGDKEQTATMLCSCATGAASANARITGVKLEDVLSLAELSEDVNTVTVRGADGYGLSLPLQYALDHKAMFVYKLNGENLPCGTQFWVPETVAKYFTRNVVDIELTAEAEVPAVEQRDESLRAEVAILNKMAKDTFAPGDMLTFEGYADDCGSAVTSVEFSLDGGETWTAFDTDGATAERWVYWNFTMQTPEAGDYQLSVRARTENGTVSPLTAKLDFTVAQPAV